jgi:uncharacterized protein (TIGR03086 family)
MNPVVAGWVEVADAFSQRLNAVTPEQWEAATPCSEWNVRQLVEHAVDVQQRSGAAMGAEVAEGLGDNPAAAWTAMRQAMLDCLQTEGTLDKVIPTPFGERPVAEALGIPTMDLLVHTWDLSRAIGHDETLPGDIVAHAYESLQPMDGMLRGPGMFADKLDVADGADLQAQFIAFCGRQP